jgi:choline dehydrogenase-like flavoprotein
LHFPEAQGCAFCGNCNQGCYAPLSAPRNLKAKRSTDNSYVPMALTADRWTNGTAITLITDAFATRIDTDGNGAARGVTWRTVSTGESWSEEAQVVVLAAGTIESPRLWLNSGLPNPNDQVGAGMTDHAPDGVAGVFSDYTGSTKGAASAARVDYPGRGSIEQLGTPPALTAANLATSRAGISGYYSNGLEGTKQGADTVGRLVGTDLKSFMAHIDQTMNILILTDDDVEPQNLVTLSTSQTDEHGPVAKVEVEGRNRSSRTVANRDFLAGEAARILRAAGAVSVHRINWSPILFHIHSTLRMGSDEDTTVLDEFAEARWVPRLFVADNSALSNGVGGPNPTLTTQAVATRTAEAIFQRYFGGDPWVATETPLPSTDPAISYALVDLGL